jgi:subtilisin family serine protease
VPRYGIAHDSHIFAGNVIGDEGFATHRSFIAGMDWAVEQGCHVISMSLGASTMLGDQPVDDYEQIGQACLDAGTLVVAAAGNEQRPASVGSLPSTPPRTHPSSWPLQPSIGGSVSRDSRAEA